MALERFGRIVDARAAKVETVAKNVALACFQAVR